MKTRVREWTLSDAGDFFYLDGPSPRGKGTEEPFTVIEKSAVAELIRERDQARLANAKLLESFQELYSCFETYNDQSSVAYRILKKFAKVGAKDE